MLIKISENLSIYFIVFQTTDRYKLEELEDASLKEEKTDVHLE